MPDILRMPEVAANTPDAVVSTWLVELGQPFVAGDAIVTIETDKAVVDVEAEIDGVLLRLLAGEGTRVEVGAPIAVWGTKDDTDLEVDDLVGTLSSSARGSAPCAAERSTPSVRASNGADPRVFASPLVRRLAAEHGLDLRAVVGTGPRSRIRRRDIEALLTGQQENEPSAATEPAVAQADVPAAAHRDVPNTRLRRAIARRLTESKQTIPHFYVRGSVRVERLLALREEINEGAATRVSVNDLVIKAVAGAHCLVPALNVQWSEEYVRHFGPVDVAVAVATEGGLVTPVVREADRLSIGQIADVTKDLAARAKNKSLRQHELEGGAVTVSNLGMFGTEEFAPIINPPQSSILAVGAVREEAVVDAGAVVPCRVMRVTLAVDHRPVDGAAAAEWMRSFVELLENPARILR